MALYITYIFITIIIYNNKNVKQPKSDITIWNMRNNYDIEFSSLRCMKR